MDLVQSESDSSEVVIVKKTKKSKKKKKEKEREVISALRWFDAWFERSFSFLFLFASLIEVFWLLCNDYGHRVFIF